MTIFKYLLRRHWTIVTNFNAEPSGIEGTKFVKIVLVMIAMPVDSENL